MRKKAIQEVESLEQLPDGLVVYDSSFHTGVVGIVAQRLVEHFYRPSAVLGKSGEDTFTGSVRGIAGFNVVDTLSSVGSYLLKFGGHEGAGGFSIKKENIKAFKAAFETECQKRLETIEKSPSAKADTIVTLPELTMDLVREIRSLSPFGIGNATPQLLIKDLQVREARTLKGAHLKVSFSDGSRFLEGIMWRVPKHPKLKKGNTVSIVCRADLNTYKGLTNVTANIQAVQ